MPDYDFDSFGDPHNVICNILDSVPQADRVIEALDAFGFIIVPTKPTQKMIEAGCDNNPTQWTEETDHGFAADVANDIYVSMVAAAKLSR